MRPAQSVVQFSTIQIHCMVYQLRLLVGFCLILVSSLSNTSQLWGLDAFKEPSPTIPEISLQDSIRIFVNNVSEVRQLYISRFSNCRTRIYNLTILRRLPHEHSIVVEFQMKKARLSHDRWPHPYHICTGEDREQSENGLILLDIPEGNNLLAIYIVLYVFFLILSSMFTGVHLAMMSMSVQNLELVRDVDQDANKRKYAADILTIRRNENFVLCTLLCCNTVCNASSTVLLEAILNELNVDANSMVFVIPQCLFLLAFCEVMPQVICSTKWALFVGSRLRYITIFFMVLTGPLTIPLSKMLDFLKRKEKSSMEEEAEIIHERQTRGMNRHLAEAMANIDKLSRIAMDILQKIDKVFVVSDKTIVNDELREKLRHEKRTRIPVYSDNDKDTIIGVLNVKDLLLFGNKLLYGNNVGSVMQLSHRSSAFCFVNWRTPIGPLLLEMKKGITLGIVFEYNPETKKDIALGIITLEDILEEVLGEMYDEFDARRNGRANSHSNPNSPKKKSKEKEKPVKKNDVRTPLLGREKRSETKRANRSRETINPEEARAAAIDMEKNKRRK